MSDASQGFDLVDRYINACFIFFFSWLVVCVTEPLIENWHIANWALQSIVTPLFTLFSILFHVYLLTFFSSLYFICLYFWQTFNCSEIRWESCLQSVVLFIQDIGVRTLFSEVYHTIRNRSLLDTNVLECLIRNNQDAVATGVAVFVVVFFTLYSFHLLLRSEHVG